MVGEKDERLEQLQDGIQQAAKRHAAQVAELRKRLIDAGVERVW